MAKVTVRVHRDDDENVKRIEVLKGRRKQKLGMDYSPKGQVFEFTIEGREDSLPSFADIVALVYREKKLFFVEKGLETLYFPESGGLGGAGTEIANGKTQTIFDIKGKDIEIQHYEFASVHPDIYSMFYCYDKKGEVSGALQLVRRTALTDVQPSPGTIHLENSIMFLELVYDTVNDYYKYGLGYPFRFANGGKLEIYSEASGTNKYLISALVLVRG